ncbi:MAG TPA: leucyl/phenylalanyl-tRNA--protein transferase [Croceibacterium sp.]|nr:leucyl/phenylalanyl-tRNA--protein transferase [Croceibacterium sp.]
MHAPAPQPIPVELLLIAYRSGIFPMADSRDDDEVYWVEPRERAVIPLDGLRLSRSLAKAVRQDRFRVTCNADFDGVIAACAAPRPGHPESWISRRIAASYRALHLAGHAHSLECWRDGELVGGLYGVGFDHAFCGESMFSRAPDASKVALAWLVALLRRAGYRLLDCQFMTEHLASLGAMAMSREAYLARLAEAVAAGPAPTLAEAYASFGGAAAAAGAGAGAGGVAAAGGAAGAAPSSSPEGAAVSCPGKLILQSLTQTS